MHLVSCPNGHQIRVTDRHLGQLVKCPSCQSSFVANTTEPAAQDMAFNEIDNGDAPLPTRGSKGLPAWSRLAALCNSFVGKPMLFMGLMLVILGRGCDATGMRSVSRSEAQYRQARMAFQLDWEVKLTGNPQNADKLRQDMFAASAEKESGEWKPMRESAMGALNYHRMWVFWYECLFIFGTLVLVLGVLTLAFTGQGAERWVAYIMIAIITFSIYVGGAAWIESIMTSTGGGPNTPLPMPRWDEKRGPGFN